MKSSYIEQRNKQEFQILVSNIRDFGMEVKEKVSELQKLYLFIISKRTLPNRSF